MVDLIDCMASGIISKTQHSLSNVMTALPMKKLESALEYRKRATSCSPVRG